jgi:putative hydrolase of the HAD superfamily
MKGLIIFDLDDTLVDTSHVYWLAKENFIALFTKAGFKKEYIDDLFESIDTDNIRQLGHSPLRYLKSMNDAYDQLISEGRIPDSKTNRERIEMYGRQILTNLPEPIEGARELLEWSGQHFSLALITRGTEELQLQKLRHADFTHYFEKITVVSHKNEDTFKSTALDFRITAGETWVIGDSIKTDINPGIKAGMKCIFYQYRHHSYQWIQEYGEKPIGEYFEIQKIKDAISILGKEV